MGDDATIGVDIGGTKVLGVAVGADGSLLADTKVATPRTSDEILEVVAEVVAGLRRRVPEAATGGVGLGAPGLVDRGGVLRVAPNLLGATGLALAGRLPGTRLRLGNDATFAAWAEWVLGAARGSSTAVVVTVGTGIGGGMVVDGDVLEGANAFAGELGHMVVNPDGPPCPCGRRGCWERYASGQALGLLARRAAEAGRLSRAVALAGGDPAAVRGEHLTRAGAEGDAEARLVLEDFARWLALGLANLVNLLDPDCVVIGGGLVDAWPVLVGPVTAAFTEEVEGFVYRPGLRLVPAALGERAGAIGGALLARSAR